MNGRSLLLGGSAIRRVCLAALLACAFTALFASRAMAVEDFSGPAFQILAPGEEGGIPYGPHSFDQAELYNKLTGKKTIGEGTLEKDYISEKFHEPKQAGDTEEFTSRAGLEIWRDKYDVPHIFGATRGDAMYGSGWVAAQDRGLLLELGLGPAYVAAMSVPGLNAFEMLLSGRSFKPSAQATAWVEAQKASLEEKGAEGDQVIEDLEEWTEGVNGYEETLPPAQRLQKVTLADAIAGFAFIGSIFGNGGGTEVANSNFLANLEAKYGTEGGLKIFRDLREVNDPEAPTTASKPFPYDLQPTGPTPPGAVVIDPGSASESAVKALQATTASRRKASNFLLVDTHMTELKHPVAVMGPQLGYFYPEIVFQGQLSAPGLEAEGIIAPISPYVFIGRGRDFAWSLTSASSENEQQFLEKLCNPEPGGEVTRESEYYEYDGECIKMKTFDAGEIGPSKTEPAHEVYFKESVHGPISGTVLVGGKPYAIANARANRDREPAGELAFSKLDSERVHSPEEFFEAANDLETTFNMAYIDNKHIAYFSTGRLPILAPGTDPSLPTLGTGAYDWRGWLSQEQHPHEIDPVSNLLLNWNNKPAPEWGAASSTWSYGPIHRVQLYTGFKNQMTEAKDATIMNRAATEDLRALKVWPEVQKVLAGGPAPSKLAEQAANMITTWAAEGASLYGKHQPKAPAAAIMEKVFTPIARAVLGPVLGGLMAEFESLEGTDNARNSGGSSFGSGWYGYVYKDLRDELGEPVAQPYSRGYCGNGSLEACRASLWSVIQNGAEELEKEQGSNLSAWRAPEVRIDFPPGGTAAQTMAWTNRSTFQQVIEFTGHAE